MEDNFTDQLALRNLIHFAAFVRCLEGDCVEIGSYADDRIIRVFEKDMESRWYLFDATDVIKTTKTNVQVFQTPLQTDIFKANKFKYVHVNTSIDNYKTCLEFFYPKMIRDGVIILEDYYNDNYPETKKIVDDFIEDKPENILRGGYHQAVIRKL
jgi:hypothetical protein